MNFHPIGRENAMEYGFSESQQPGDTPGAPPGDWLLTLARSRDGGSTWTPLDRPEVVDLLGGLGQPKSLLEISLKGRGIELGAVRNDGRIEESMVGMLDAATRKRAADYYARLLSGSRK